MKHMKQLKERLLQSIRAMRHSLVALFIIFFGIVIAFTISVNTATAGPGTPFGGMITMVIDCTCTGNYAVYFQDLTRMFTGDLGSDQPAKDTSYEDGITLPLIYEPGQTIVYQFGPPLSSGAWMLGTWQEGGVCEIEVYEECVEIETEGTMYMVGTSQ